jgi:hypothetical protein
LNAVTAASRSKGRAGASLDAEADADAVGATFATSCVTVFEAGAVETVVVAGALVEGSTLGTAGRVSAGSVTLVSAAAGTKDGAAFSTPRLCVCFVMSARTPKAPPPIATTLIAIGQRGTLRLRAG